MSKNKNNKPVWSSRISKDTSYIFQKVGSSLRIDRRLFKEDLRGSIAHVEMLCKQKILSLSIKNKILDRFLPLINSIALLSTKNVMVSG